MYVRRVDEFMYFGVSALRVVPIASLGDGDDKLKRCIIIGTIVKKQTLRPSVLKQLAVEVCGFAVQCSHRLVGSSYVYFRKFVIVMLCLYG